MKKIYIIQGQDENKRISFAIEHLEKSLVKTGYTVHKMTDKELGNDYRTIKEEKIFVGDRKNSEFIQGLEEQDLLLYHTATPEGEGFYLASCAGKLTVVSGGSDTGVLYGCLELCERIEKEGAMPREIDFGDGPVNKLRGPAIGLQKTKLEPPRQTYEYPITPDRFPWFYDKPLWQKFLDMMLKERCNVLYIWSGHPFSSLIKLEEYPEALEVTEEEFKMNEEVFAWLTEECNKRGIWVVLKFYNIHIPYPFAVKHGLDLLQSNINPLVADYTRKSIAEFVRAYPNIGLMACLGEALRGTQNKIDWFVDTILPGVKDGMALAGLKEEPPVILRGHDCDPKATMEQAMKVYSNLYTMWKYNGEGLTTHLPRGEWQKTHQDLSELGSTHIINVHILADLEPFRFGAPSFIQKCMQASKYRLGGNGLHLYPLFYWDWPYSPDKVEPRLEQLDRDWMWFETWFRYAWDPDRDPKQEHDYWISRIVEQFGCTEKGATLLLDAMESSGECAPRILSRVGITEGNRQTMSLGMTMSQFTNVKRYRPNLQLWKSVAEQGEQPDDYITRELKGEPHIGETPYDMIEEINYYSKRALEAIHEAKPYISKNKKEYEYMVTDIEAIHMMTRSYSLKLEAAMEVLRYKYTMDEDLLGDVNLLEKASVLMEESLEIYKELANLTEKTYLYANSMQTPQRQIPFKNGETYGHWTQCLPEYELELANFKKHVEDIKKGIVPKENEGGEDIEPLPSSPFKLLSDSCETYTVETKNTIFTDCDWAIENCAAELVGLTGVRFGLGEAIEKGITVKLELEEDAQILIGYMNAKGVEWLQVPDLETNTHADDRGGLDVVIANAMKVTSSPSINIHAFQYEKGIHEIYLGTGAYVIAGVIPKDVKMTTRNADLVGESLQSLDWLYE